MPVTERDRLIEAILAFLQGEDLLSVADIRSALEREIDRAGTEALLALKDRLAADSGWDYHPPDPLARRIHHLLADRFLDPESRLAGAEVVSQLGSAPIVLFANHLSYADANVLEILLQRAGAGELANRLTALAGPKVFTSRQRRFSSLCFGTVKVPQSAEVASGEASMDSRTIARAARHSIQVACDRLRSGDALLLFGEGTRSRSGGMQRMLPAVARYLGVPGTYVLPVGLMGSERLFPIDGALRATTVVARLGRPVRADALIAGAHGNKTLLMDAIGLAVRNLVAPAYRGVYADAANFPAAAEVLSESLPAQPSRPGTDRTSQQSGP